MTSNQFKTIVSLEAFTAADVPTLLAAVNLLLSDTCYMYGLPFIDDSGTDYTCYLARYSSEVVAAKAWNDRKRITYQVSQNLSPTTLLVDVNLQLSVGFQPLGEVFFDPNTSLFSLMLVRYEEPV